MFFFLFLIVEQVLLCQCMTLFLCYFRTILLDQLSHDSVLKLTVGETMEAGGRVGWVCVFTQLSSGLTQVSLHKYHTHTLSPTVDMMCAVALMHTTVFYI